MAGFSPGGSWIVPKLPKQFPPRLRSLMSSFEFPMALTVGMSAAKPKNKTNVCKEELPATIIYALRPEVLDHVMIRHFRTFNSNFCTKF